MMAWQSNWEKGAQLNEMVKEILNNMGDEWFVAHPAVLVTHFELESAIKDAVDKQNRREEMKKTLAEDALTRKFETLGVAETGDSRTPTAGQSCSRAAGAPLKRLVPSLGLGDPDDLAKNLEETLNLVTDDLDEQEQKPKLKLVRRGTARPRLFSAQDLATNIKRVVPKLVLKEGTPRKFFKSKAATEHLNTPIQHPPLVPSVSVSSPTDQKQSLLTKSTSRTKLKSSSSGSLNVHEIFEDQLTTPAQNSKMGSTRTSTRKTAADSAYKTPAQSASTGARASTRKTSSRKASLTDVCDESLVTKSVSKPPRMAKLVEEVPVSTRSSARRKAALKRL